MVVCMLFALVRAKSLGAPAYGSSDEISGLVKYLVHDRGGMLSVPSWPVMARHGFEGE